MWGGRGPDGQEPEPPLGTTEGHDEFHTSAQFSFGTDVLRHGRPVGPMEDTDPSIGVTDVLGIGQDSAH